MKDNNQTENIYEKFIGDIHEMHKNCFFHWPLEGNPKHPMAYHIMQVEKLMKNCSNPVKLRKEIIQYLKSLAFFERQFGDLKPFYMGLKKIMYQPEYQEQALWISHINDLSIAKQKADETADLLKEHSLQVGELQTKIKKYIHDVDYYKKELESKNALLDIKKQQTIALEEKLLTANLCFKKDENGLYQEFVKLHQRIDRIEYENKNLYEELKKLTEEKAALQEERDRYKQLYEDAINKLKAIRKEEAGSHYSNSLPSAMYFSKG